MPDTQPRDRDTLKLTAPPAGQPVVAPTLFQLRGAPGMEGLGPGLVWEVDAGLTLPAGVQGEAERLLGLADTAAAMTVAQKLLGPEEALAGADATWTDEQAAGKCILTRCLLMEGRLDAAREMLGTHRRDDRLALADAALHLAEGSLRQASVRMEDALERDPHGAGEHYVLALLKVTQGNSEEASRLLRRVAASVPSHAVARHQLGKLTQAEGDGARAGTLFEMAWELAPDFAAPALALAEMFMETRQLGEAMNILSLATERSPNLLAPRLLQLRILLDARRTAPAMQLAEALMESAPNREDITLLWAEALMQADHGEQAQTALETLLGSGGMQDEARVRHLMSRLALSADPPRVEEAARHLTRAIVVAPDRGEFMLELAQLQLALQQPKDAAATLERISQADVDLSTLLSAAVMASKNGLGSVARRLGKNAMERVAGTPVEDQLRALVGTL